MRRSPLLVVVAALGLVTACGGDDSSGSTSSSDSSSSSESSNADPVIDPGDGGHYTVDIAPADFTSVVDNPFFPMLVGSVWTYQETNPEGKQTDTVTVLDQHKTVMGVDTIVVHDVATDEAGTTVEDTYDWFAQDSSGNVWYFGEDTTSFDNGKTSTDGSWEAGVDGALPGIVMQADPKVSSTGYRQEYQAGVAEDMGQVISIGDEVTVPAGTYDETVHTRDWSPIEPDVIEEKIYARAIGDVHEATVSPADEQEEVVLLSFTPPK